MRSAVSLADRPGSLVSLRLTTMPTVLITPEALLEQPGPHVDRLVGAGFEVRYPQDRSFTRGHFGTDETIAQFEGIDAVLAGGERLTEAVLEGCPGLRSIARCGVGFDRVDIPAATRLGRVVTITPTANHAAVAEQAIALMFAAAKRVVPHDRLVRSGGWSTEPMQPIRGRTLGIFGLGRIGRSMATRCASLGMTVIATEKYPDESFCTEQGIELVDFDALLAGSDYLSIHCPINDETRGVFDAGALARMKPGSVLINTARGGIIVERDLLAALQDGPLSAAGLDVFEQEPAGADNPLFALENIVVSPHLAGADVTSLQDMANEAADCIATLYEGNWPEAAVVNPDVRANWSW
ncbi:MAG: phosphoglycerate dehydrogenase [Planctomycetaceae bacterium]